MYNSFSLPLWFEDKDIINLDFDKNRIIDEIYLRLTDFGGDSYVSLKINDIEFDKKEVNNKPSIIIWNNNISNNDKVQIEFSGEKSLVFDFGILYKNATELEKNIKKYQFTLKHYNDENKIFNFKEHIGEKYIMIQVFQLHCITCQEKLPFINNYAKFYKNTKIISMNAGERPEDIAYYFNKNNIDIECIIDSDYEICRQLEVYGVPHTIFFGMEGEILQRGNLSTEEISIILDKLEDNNLNTK